MLEGVLCEDRPLFVTSSALTSARDSIAFETLETQADCLLTVDSDQSFETADVAALLDAIAYDKADVCASAVGHKRFDPVRVRVAALRYDRDVLRAGVPDYNFQPTPQRGAEGFQLGARRYLYARVGMGVTLIHRRVLAELSRTAPSYRVLDPASDPGAPSTLDMPSLYGEGSVDGESITDDYGFSRKAIAAGFRVAVHVNGEAVHWAGPVGFPNNAPALLAEKGIAF